MSPIANMEQALLQQFQQLVAAHTGLQIRAQELAAFQQTLLARSKALQLSQPEKYCRLLENASTQSAQEWTQLIALLTNQESYFFRDKGQFSLLRQTILPKLIEANHERRELRLWSAGCSTGEEAFSLAMLVDQLLPARENWKIFILGTDLKEAALDKARRGLFSPWSFRLVEPAMQQIYFREQQSDYKLNARIRDMVTFRAGNLFKDSFPSKAAGIYEMDLILCRNVFIYFEASAVSVVINKMAKTLREGGYLMTGHAELNTQNVQPLQARVLTGSVVYQRDNNGNLSNAARSTPAAPPAPALTSPVFISPIPPAPNTSLPANRTTPRSEVAAIIPAAPTDLLAEAEVLFRQKSYVAALEKTIQCLQSEPQNHDALCMAAQSCANLGRYDEAAGYCRRAIAVDSFAPVPYSLLAHIEEERGASEVAAQLLKKVIYLAPNFIPAYLELADLHQKQGDQTRAQKMRASALELLRGLPPETIVEPYELAAPEIIRQLQSASVG